MIILEAAQKATPDGERAPYYLGNLQAAIQRSDPQLVAGLRARSRFFDPMEKLGIAAYNIGRDPEEARKCYRKAFNANPSDARLLYERDQLEKRIGAPPQERLERLETHLDLVEVRDDLVVELVTLGPARKSSIADLQLVPNDLCGDLGQAWLSKIWQYAKQILPRKPFSQ